MKLIKLLADIDQPFDMKSGTILVADDNPWPRTFFICNSRNFPFSVSVNDAEELTTEEYLDIVEHINKL